MKSPCADEARTGVSALPLKAEEARASAAGRVEVLAVQTPTVLAEVANSGASLRVNTLAGRVSALLAVCAVRRTVGRVGSSTPEVDAIGPVPTDVVPARMGLGPRMQELAVSVATTRSLVTIPWAGRRVHECASVLDAPIGMRAGLGVPVLRRARLGSNPNRRSC